MAERYIPEHRRTQFKAKSTFKPEELRRRREEQQVEIRRAKREENLAKRRGIGTGENRPGASLGAAPDSDDENTPSETQVCLFFPPFPPAPFLVFSSEVHAWPVPPSSRSRSVAAPSTPPLCTPLSAVVIPSVRLGPQFGAASPRTPSHGSRGAS